MKILYIRDQSEKNFVQFCDFSYTTDQTGDNLLF